MLTEKECSTYHGEFDSPLSLSNIDIDVFFNILFILMNGN